RRLRDQVRRTEEDHAARRRLQPAEPAGAGELRLLLRAQVHGRQPGFRRAVQRLRAASPELCGAARDPRRSALRVVAPQAGWMTFSTRMAWIETCAATRPARSVKAWAAGASGAATTIGAPSSPPVRTRVSIGTS